jgi:hypothetical protein
MAGTEAKEQAFAQNLVEAAKSLNDDFDRVSSIVQRLMLSGITWADADLMSLTGQPRYSHLTAEGITNLVELLGNFDTFLDAHLDNDMGKPIRRQIFEAALPG